MKKSILVLAFALLALPAKAEVKRYVATPLLRGQGFTTTAATTLQNYFRANSIKAKALVAKTNSFTMAFSFMATATTVSRMNGLPANFALSQIHKNQIVRRQAANNSSSGALAHLNMWGPMRVLGTFQQSGMTTGQRDPDTDLPLDGTVVCVTDTGVAWDHPRLRNRIYGQFTTAYDPYDVPPVPVSAGSSHCTVPDPVNPSATDTIPCNTPYYASADYNQYCGSPSPGNACGYDDDGHGSHVSGIIAAEDLNTGDPLIDVRGIDPHARLIAAKGIGWHWLYDPTNPQANEEGYGYEYIGYDDDLAEAIYVCIFSGAQVINMSWGGGESQVIDDAIAEAANWGVIMAAAAGNESDPTTGPGAVIAPASNPLVLSVSALDATGNIAYFSSVGDKVDFIAPGVDILSTTLVSPGITTGGQPVGTYAYYDGTSMATPFVSGTAALMLEHAIYASVTDLVGTDIGLARQYEGQFGLINTEASCRH